MNDSPKKRILFVDDEQSVLLVLQAFMQRISNEWESAFVDSGPKALALMAQKPFDVIISDMRMPDMNGTELLNEVMKRYPRTVRIVLSGHADEQTVQESVGVAHQWVAKPFDLKVLKANLTRIGNFQARTHKIPLYEAEKRVLNATHADVGSYLLSIWGLPIPLVETVALHHEPALAADRTFNALGAVHVASVWSYEQTPSAREFPGTPLDLNYLREIGVGDRLDQWRQRLVNR